MKIIEYQITITGYKRKMGGNEIENLCSFSHFTGIDFFFFLNCSNIR